MAASRNPSKQKPPQVAVVGCGYWGRNLVRIFDSLRALKVVCDPYDKAQKISRSIAPKVPVISDFDRILNDPAISAVVIATPAATHAGLVSRALSADKHVFVEKPLAVSVQNGEEIVELAKRLQRIVMVGHILSYHPAVIKLNQLIDAGELGKILYINSHRLNFGKVRREENILWSFAPHDISTILMLLGEFPSHVSASGGDYIRKGIYDLTFSTMEFPSGVKAHIFVSWLHPFKEQKLVIIGDKKMAVFDDTRAEQKLMLYPHTIEWQRREAIAHKMDGQSIPVESTEPLLAECVHFLDCIQNNHQPLTNAEEGLRVLKILAASEESLKQNGKTVQIGNQSSPYFVHPSSEIDREVQIGEGTKIWHFTHVLSNSKIGKNCVIGQNVMIGPQVTIGDNVKIQNNVSVYKGVTLESDVFCGPSMVFTNVINPRSAVPRKSEFRETRVGKGATLGANCTILAGVDIGDYAFVGAGAVVTKNLPSYALATGVPARIKGWMCECGVKLQFSSNKANCKDCGRKYARKGSQHIRQL
jgi:UDP-2-acetamido-3-amino-2,3-dideoxy-glucuronate N-acetyltransferase